MSRKNTALVMILTVGLLGSAQAADNRITPPIVPENIEAPEGSKPILVGHAYGTQNYICVPAATATGGDWLFLGPQATVYGPDGQQIITHFLSKNPFLNDELNATWQHSRDSSAVWAKRLRGSSDPAYVAPGAVEWLLLEMTGALPGPTGGDKVSTTKFIQRVNTRGGVKPPASECTASTPNARRLVDYEADYYFYE